MKTVLLSCLAILLGVLFLGCAAKQAAPSLRGFVVENGMIVDDQPTEIFEEMLSPNEPLKLALKAEKTQDITDLETTTEPSETTTEPNGISINILDTEMLGNQGENVVLTLQFINEQRDSFVELVLNDSDYGTNKLYSSAASVNKVVAVDTYFENDLWITDVVLLMPKTKSAEERTIEITEVVFLRNLVDDRINATLTECESTMIKVIVTEEPVQTSYLFFDFEENEDGYTVTAINVEFGLPSLVFFPAYYKGAAVTEIGYDLLGGTYAEIENLGIPETVIRYNGRMSNSTVKNNMYIFTRNMTNKMDFGDELIGYTDESNVFMFSEFKQCDLGRALTTSSDYNGWLNISYWD